MAKHTLKVDHGFQHLRLDIYLTHVLPETPSRTFIKELITQGRVQVNQKQVKAHYKVNTGDSIDVECPEAEEVMKDIQPEDIPLDIFFEDRQIMIINKPAGMLVHPSASCQTGTLVNALAFYCLQDHEGRDDRSLSDGHAAFRPGIVHRLDRETSGLICVAKDNRSHIRLTREFEKRRVKKKYVALVSGHLELEEGKIDVPIGRHPDHWDKMAVSFKEGARDSLTRYQVLMRVTQKSGPWSGKLTLLALFPNSGRTHQLRVHMAHIGHPILGDHKYGKKNSFSRLALHAQGLGFKHPDNKHFIEFILPMPQEFLKFKD